MDDAALAAAEPRRAALSCRWPRCRRSSAYFRELGRDPTDVELETHRPDLERALQPQDAGRPDSLSRRRGRAAVRQHAQGDDLRRHAGDSPRGWRRRLVRQRLFATTPAWSGSTTSYNVVFKVETHNHPSALEPYGGANTGIGGVIRDPLGTGLGAKPICNTDVFCFAPPDTPADRLPAGRAASAAGDEGRGRRRARLRQPHGHSHGQRGGLLRPPLPGQSAGLLRQRRPDPARQVVQSSRSPAT